MNLSYDILLRLYYDVLPGWIHEFLSDLFQPEANQAIFPAAVYRPLYPLATKKCHTWGESPRTSIWGWFTSSIYGDLWWFWGWFIDFGDAKNTVYSWVYHRKLPDCSRYLEALEASLGVEGRAWYTPDNKWLLKLMSPPSSRVASNNIYIYNYIYMILYTFSAISYLIIH